MNVSCNCRRHRLVPGSHLSMRDTDNVETERHDAAGCYRRIPNGNPQPLEPVQRAATLRVLDEDGPA